jgi:2-(1,2-epoxy-1,2-dihydrophenyl)acetyl-CoA isomerase
LLRELGGDGVLLLTLNRPETMNALSAEIGRGIVDACRETRTNPAIRVIVITGTGRGFCSGADLSASRRSGGEGGAAPSKWPTLDKSGGSGDFVAAMAECNVPIVAAINGAAAGAGFGMALCCDIRIASEQARMGSIFIKRGIAADYGASTWLPKLVGHSKALELFYSGDLLGADELLRIGLVNKVVPHESLLEETLAYARKIAKGPALAYAYIRRNVMRSHDMQLRDHAEYEWRNQLDVLGTADNIEGFAAFREGREPKFTGN